MPTKVVQQGTVSDKLIGRCEQACQKLTALAEEVPENKFDYRPVQLVRTFADALKHVAFWNQYVADSARGRKGADTANELPRDGYSTKARIVDALKCSATDAADALKGNASGVTFIEHNCEHYGQLVVYARFVSRVGAFSPARRICHILIPERHVRG
jgi:DinB superfamily